MNTMRDDGGPAFPLTTPKWHELCSDNGYESIDFTMGMSLRDYFAAKALALVSEQCATDTMNGMSKPDYFAARAYEVADAMLRARDAA